MHAVDWPTIFELPRCSLIMFQNAKQIFHSENCSQLMFSGNERSGVYFIEKEVHCQYYCRVPEGKSSVGISHPQSSSSQKETSGVKQQFCYMCLLLYVWWLGVGVGDYNTLHRCGCQERWLKFWNKYFFQSSYRNVQKPLTWTHPPKISEINTNNLNNLVQCLYPVSKLFTMYFVFIYFHESYEKGMTRICLTCKSEESISWSLKLRLHCLKLVNALGYVLNEDWKM